MSGEGPETRVAVDAVPRSEGDGGGESGSAPSLFISYRRRDTSGHALLLHDRLKQRFGTENVFLDVAALEPGADWRKVITTRAGGCGILLALIGPHWLSILEELDQRGVKGDVDDVARQELELALSNESHIEVLPVLVDDATMPSKGSLPRSLWALTDTQAAELRSAGYDEDVKRLIARLERIAADAGSAGSPDSQPANRLPVREPAHGPQTQHAAHHERIASLMSGTGHVVVVVGSGVNAGCKTLPDGERLAAELAKSFEYEAVSERLRLSEVAEWVDVHHGSPDLYLSLKEKLTVECEPSNVHKFLAGFPKVLEEVGRPRAHQLILTTNYDTALERAFQDARQPFDLAIYTASSRGFVHVPWDGDAQPITEPNRYFAFPIGDDLELSRTVIVKIHGAITGDEPRYPGQTDYVITDDNYIDYLSGSSVEEIVPFQILQKLRSSHCLFLGYEVGHWSLRVFLKRVWGPHIAARSWAVEEDPSVFERELWDESGVKVVAEPLDYFVTALRDCLEVMP